LILGWKREEVIDGETVELMLMKQMKRMATEGMGGENGEGREVKRKGG